MLKRKIKFSCDIFPSEQFMKRLSHMHASPSDNEAAKITLKGVGAFILKINFYYFHLVLVSSPHSGCHCFLYNFIKSLWLTQWGCVVTTSININDGYDDYIRNPKGDVRHTPTPQKHYTILRFAPLTPSPHTPTLH